MPVFAETLLTPLPGHHRQACPLPSVLMLESSVVVRGTAEKIAPNQVSVEGHPEGAITLCATSERVRLVERRVGSVEGRSRTARVRAIHPHLSGTAAAHEGVDIMGDKTLHTAPRAPRKRVWRCVQPG